MLVFLIFFFFKQKTAYEMRISDWSSDVCSSDLVARRHAIGRGAEFAGVRKATILDAAVGPDQHRQRRASRLAHRKARIGRHRHALAAFPLLARQRPTDFCREHALGRLPEIGCASCKARVCTYVYNSWDVASFKKNKIQE